MTCSHFAEGQVLFREGDPADGVFRLLSGSLDILRELDGEPSFSARWARARLLERWALWKTAAAVRPLEPPARLRQNSSHRPSSSIRSQTCRRPLAS